MWRLSSLLIFGLVATVGCSAPAPDPGPSACSDEAGYEINVIEPLDMVGLGASPFYPAGDSTPGGSITTNVETIADGARCGSTAALVIRSSGFDDWGSISGLSNFGPRDETAYEGMWFWARAPGNTNEKFTLYLDDPNTYASPGSGYCKNCIVGDGGTTYVDPITGQPMTGQSGSPSGTDQCGNSYTAGVTVTREWRIYTIPFARFQQANQPNRVPNALLTHVGPVPGTALLTNALESFTVRIPNKSQTELWIDDLGFYRKKAAAPGADAANDAN